MKSWSSLGGSDIKKKLVNNLLAFELTKSLRLSLIQIQLGFHLISLFFLSHLNFQMRINYGTFGTDRFYPKKITFKKCAKRNAAFYFCIFPHFHSS